MQDMFSNIFKHSIYLMFSTCPWTFRTDGRSLMQFGGIRQKCIADTRMASRCCNLVVYDGNTSLIHEILLCQEFWSKERTLTEIIGTHIDVYPWWCHTCVENQGATIVYRIAFSLYNRRTFNIWSYWEVNLLMALKMLF